MTVQSYLGQIIPGFLFLLLIGFFASCSDSKETRMQRYLIQGNTKIREQEYEQAEKYLHSALALDSCFADALNNLGTIEHRRKNPVSAIAYYSRAISCRDTFLLAYYNRANVYYETGDAEKGLADVNVVLRQYPDSSDVLELKALLLWKQRDLPGAATLFKRILKKNPKSLEALINLGTVYTSAKAFDSARVFLREAMNLKSDDHRVFNALAVLEASSGDFVLARDWIERALKAESEDPFYLNNKGYILLRQNKYDSAIQYINASIASDPYNGWAYRNKGIFFYLTGRFAEALDMFANARRLDPTVDELYYWTGVALMKSGDTVEGCRLIKLAETRNDVPAGERPPGCE